jgi:hypothetical protein
LKILPHCDGTVPYPVYKKGCSSGGTVSGLKRKRLSVGTVSHEGVHVKKGVLNINKMEAFKKRRI